MQNRRDCLFMGCTRDLQQITNCFLPTKPLTSAHPASPFVLFIINLDLVVNSIFSVLFFIPFLVLLFFFFFFSILPICSSQTTNNLVQGQSISDEQTLLSAHQIFQLGFFSPGSSPYRYLGIWYYNISSQTVVWVANRENPIAANTTATLTLTAAGSLNLTVGAGTILWSSNTSTAVSATISDAGNLLLEASDGTKAWQSFDYPTDTFLPGMRISLSTRTGVEQRFTSWRSSDDPDVGNYSLGLDPSGSGQIFIWEGSTLRWRSGQWNGDTFIGTTMAALYLYGFSLTNYIASGVMYFTFSPVNTSLVRFVMQWDGVENTTLLVGSAGGSNIWEEVWASPQNDCDMYGECGGNGLCNPDGSPICGCLYGFVPSAASGSQNWSNGCTRRTSLQCERNSNSSSVNNEPDDGFFEVGGVKLPDKAEWQSAVADGDGCESYCAGNCSCTGYAFVENIGCLVWVGQLIDTYQFTQATNGNNLYIKLAASELLFYWETFRNEQTR